MWLILKGWTGISFSEKDFAERTIIQQCWLLVDAKVLAFDLI